MGRIAGTAMEVTRWDKFDNSSNGNIAGTPDFETG